MYESGKTSPVIKKSYEIAYALCRIAAKIPEKPFADALANEGVKILGFAAEEEYGKAGRALAAAEYFIKLGAGVGFIYFANSEVLLDEIALLNEMIAGLLNAPKTEPADLSGIFTPVAVAETSSSLPSFVPSAVPADFGEPFGSELTTEGHGRIKAGIHASNLPSFSEFENMDFRRPSFAKNSGGARHEDDGRTQSGNNQATDSGNPAIVKVESGNKNSPEIIELIKSGNRHDAILAIIRQSGNCRIKDIQDFFPECSERTLRYDLQSLAEQNLIEKIGTGGPAVFYKNRG
jgi:DNA-binding HxlR family transcriptional regulator